MKPRKYQQTSINIIIKKLKIKKNILFVAPCAAGKTFIFSHIAKWLHENNRNVLILMDREQLVSQTAQKIRECSSVRVGIVCATAGHKQHKGITVASRQSFEKYLTENPDLKYNLLILDECHLVNQEHGQYLNIINELKVRYPDMRILGCTATPYRMSGYIYGWEKMWHEIDCHIKTSALINDGFLTPLRWKVRREDKLEKLKTQNNGDLKESEHFEVVSQNYFLESIYDVWKNYCSDKKTVIYALNIAHAEAIGALFQKMNIRAGVIHSGMSRDEIRGKINEFDKILINVGILTIGSDIPDITAIILARKILSTSLFFQIIGRGARLFPGKKDCLIIDLCGSALLHGNDPDNPILFNAKNQDAEKFKLCPDCEMMITYAAPKCPACDFFFPIESSDISIEKKETTDIGDIVDLEDYEKIECDNITYRFHRTKKPLPTVWTKFWFRGKEIASIWLCPEHSGFAKQNADKYWIEMWGSDPPPNSVDDFLIRKMELSTKAEITIDVTPRYPKVIKIKNKLF